MSNCYKLSDSNHLVPTDDPIEIQVSDVHENIKKNGYWLELRTSPEGTWVGAEAFIYKLGTPERHPNKPLYYVPIFGTNTDFGSLVANNFADLLVILAHTKPLLDMIGLEVSSRLHELNNA